MDIVDVAKVARNFGKNKQTDPNWDETKKADINGDEKINIVDIATVARYFGRGCYFL
ncbi:MAG: dockerin type I domain-containing protein [Candidatus Aenigmarchaeota archaeon]|nr:dockerin type I domain-containing protein [Candidatus Aenigmarchaeota archaeon]